MKRLMYCPIYIDELDGIFEKGITPSSSGSIDLYHNRNDAEFFCYTDNPNDMCILKVLVDEHSLKAFTTFYCMQICTVYEYKGMIPTDSIALNENDIEFVKSKNYSYDADH